MPRSPGSTRRSAGECHGACEDRHDLAHIGVAQPPEQSSHRFRIRDNLESLPSCHVRLLTERDYVSCKAIYQVGSSRLEPEVRESEGVAG
jgi:hypothetical protein